MLSIHVIVEAEAIGRVGGSVRIFGSDAENRTDKSGLFPLQPGPGRLDVHVKTWKDPKGNHWDEAFNTQHRRKSNTDGNP